MTTVKPCPWHARILARACRSLPHLGAKTRKRLARDLARACPRCGQTHTSWRRNPASNPMDNRQCRTCIRARRGAKKQDRREVA